ncbi:hypothetical protein [Aurantimonas marianensis]|uniref:Uncharacterized protein n=1 Tax=Aurantimonas marianensis TaxID=2920428 RepID=A0A9X2H830_9HYPH|nr:hypothetical protein [Aurantimonas marianensis]MCP3054993.1 hypothetical protein [Aurantimonas marianensis]
MLREFAAKQQIVDRDHVFSDLISERDGRQLGVLAVACEALAGGCFDARALARLLLDEETRLDICAERLAQAAPGAGAELAGMALALVYLPFPIPDTFATLAFEPLDLRQVARRVDPDRRLSPRTRLFFADRLMRNRTVHGLLAATGAAVALYENGGVGDAAFDVRPERLRRLADFAVALANRPALFAAMLRACDEGDWQRVDELCRHVAGDTGREGVDGARPPWLADCLLLTLLPTCDTIDAAARLLAVWAGSAVYRSAVAARGDAAPDPDSPDLTGAANLAAASAGA